MKLYYSPGACSLAPHIVARELGLAVDLDKTDTKTKQTSAGADFLQVNPKGYVPALQMDDGAVLTEGPAIVQFLADQKPGTLAPANGTLERYRLQEMLNYITAELHKTYAPLFSNPSEDVKTERKEYLRKRYKLLDELLGKQEYLMGNQFTVADAYLFTVTNWAKFIGLDLSAYPNVLAFQKRVAARPAVQEAMKEEGLLKAA